MDEDVIRKQLRFVLEKTGFDFGGECKVYKGKVRDNYTISDKRIIVTTDRLSAFDVILCTLPFKGQVLNQLSSFWFEKSKSIIPNHLIEVPDPNVTIAKNCNPIPVEFVVRGYITGVTTTSIWYSYINGNREFCGHRLPEGLKKDQELDMPIVTPSTKAEKGGHDESVSRADIIKRGIMDGDEFDELAEASLRLFELGSRVAEKNGIILVDTKYEFGKDEDGEVMIIDEMHTPDSSRFWYKNAYQEMFEKGLEQKRIDKEYVRKWLADKGFIGEGSVPSIPDDIRIEAARRYIEAYEQITGLRFNAKAGDPIARIVENLRRRGYLDG